MPERHFPVRPDLTQLKHQAKDLLRAMRQSDPSAKLSGAQHALARSYGIPSWPRLDREIYPPELGCHADESLALHGTPLAGTALLHLCVDNDEIESARWLIERGADPNVRAEIDSEGFGGHTPLFGCVVSQPYRVRLRRNDAFARLLLDHGADPNVSASLRKRLRFVEDESMHEYRDVTPLAWGRRFHDQSWVNQLVMRLLTSLGAPLAPPRARASTRRFTGVKYLMGLAPEQPDRGDREACRQHQKADRA